MKNLFYTLSLVFVIFAVSCSPDTMDDKVDAEALNTLESMKGPANFQKNGPSVGAALVSNQTISCGYENLPVYTIYSYGGVLESFDRRVEVAVIKDNTIIDGFFLDILANQNVSSNVPAFRGTYYEKIGDVELRIISIRNGANDITTSYTLHTNTPFVDNCVSREPKEPFSIDGHVCNGSGCSHYEN